MSSVISDRKTTSVADNGFTYHLKMSQIFVGIMDYDCNRMHW